MPRTSRHAHNISLSSQQRQRTEPPQPASEYIAGILSSCPRLGRLRAPPPLMFAVFAGCPRRPRPPAPEPANVADDDDIAEAQAQHGRRHRGVPEDQDRWILMTPASPSDAWLRLSIGHTWGGGYRLRRKACGCSGTMTSILGGKHYEPAEMVTCLPGDVEA